MKLPTLTNIETTTNTKTMKATIILNRWKEAAAVINGREVRLTASALPEGHYDRAAFDAYCISLVGEEVEVVEKPGYGAYPADYSPVVWRFGYATILVKDYEEGFYKKRIPVKYDGVKFFDLSHIHKPLEFISKLEEFGEVEI